MQPLTATANLPEDIEAVLGRFQTWSATRKTPPCLAACRQAYASSPMKKPLNPAAIAGRPTRNRP